ncbi:MAG: type IV secretion system protein [Rhodospirillales bacterium]|nr:type IV secretion system protein [Alphaproteobacteria bacterium]MCB9986944.1 type IV secretion system protein [Rhodospirillales bacterium]USO08281.1 MAG: type IV secretion system protein [Rhodospirillales bacterium]
MADNKGGDASLWMLLFLVAIFWGGGWLIWHNFRPQISTGILAVRSAEMSLSSLWWNNDDKLNVPVTYQANDDQGLHAKMGDEGVVAVRSTRFGAWRDFARDADPKNLRNDQIPVLTYVALWPLRFVIAGCLALLFVWTIFRGPTSKFHRKLGLEGLIADQSKIFKVIRPFLKFNPVKQPYRVPGAPVPHELPLFSEALSPEEWIAFNEIDMVDGKPDRTQSEEYFARQLGPRWRGYQALPTELRVLLACFCLKAARKREQSDEMLGRLCACWDAKTGLKLSRDRKLSWEARRILRDKKLSESVLTSCGRHAYVTTAMMRALDTARNEGGVLAPAQFIWLRAHNRGLWYPLNNMGRQAFHAEALGCAAHYRAEKQINRPIPRPRVGDAYDGLIDYLANTVLVRPIPPRAEGGRRRKKPAIAA